MTRREVCWHHRLHRSRLACILSVSGVWGVGSAGGELVERGRTRFRIDGIRPLSCIPRKLGFIKIVRGASHSVPIQRAQSRRVWSTFALSYARYGGSLHGMAVVACGTGDLVVNAVAAPGVSAGEDVRPRSHADYSVYKLSSAVRGSAAQCCILSLRGSC